VYVDDPDSLASELASRGLTFLQGDHQSWWWPSGFRGFG